MNYNRRLNVESWPGGGGGNIARLSAQVQQSEQRNCQQETDDIHSQFTHQESRSTTHQSAEAP
jgi:hypothetical protein